MKRSKVFATILLAATMAMSVALTGCSKGETTDVAEETGWEPIPEATEEPAPTEAPVEEVVEEEEFVEGCYRSELTNEWIDESLKDQRPIAIMVDNESKALPHFGVNSADIVYEIMNSTENNRITRLMCIVKDYNSVKQLGSVRSTRPTNFMLAAEWDAILVHEGGPFYNDEYYAKDYVNNLNGGCARIINGKATEFTAYMVNEAYTNTKGNSYDSISKRIEDSGYSSTYTEHYEGNHFTFSNKDYDLSDVYKDAYTASFVKIPFPHNSSELHYNADTNTYDYYEYGSKHIDAGDGDKVTSFKNAIIYSCSFCKLDPNGYLIYNIIGSGLDGYYLTNGKMIPIYWSKDGETNISKYQSTETQEDILMNTGKTYIAVVPDDSWDDLVIQ